jgi:hypothetical protein
VGGELVNKSVYRVRIRTEIGRDQFGFDRCRKAIKPWGLLGANLGRCILGECGCRKADRGENEQKPRRHFPFAYEYTHTKERRTWSSRMTFSLSQSLFDLPENSNHRAAFPCEKAQLVPKANDSSLSRGVHVVHSRSHPS